MEEKIKALLSKLYADRQRVVNDANLVLSVINSQISELESILGLSPNAPTTEPPKEETKAASSQPG